MIHINNRFLCKYIFSLYHKSTAWEIVFLIFNNNYRPPTFEKSRNLLYNKKSLLHFRVLLQVYVMKALNELRLLKNLKEVVL